MATAAKKTAPTRAKTETKFDAATDAVAAAETFTSQARDQYDTMLTAFNDQAETFRGQAEDMLQAVRANVETAQSRIQSANAELMNAARTEMAEAVDFANELARAKTLGDALEIHRGYWTNLFQTRTERAREFANLSVETARESFEPFSKSMSSFGGAAGFEKFFPFAAK